MKNGLVKTGWISLIILVSVIILTQETASGQSRFRPSNYTVLQAGGLFGLESSTSVEPMNGYQFQFVFGKQLGEQTYLGLGIGNDVYRGTTELASGMKATRRMNTLPIFVDFRKTVFNVSVLGRLGLVADAGYAPGIGGDYFRGFMGKAGMTYSHLLADRSDLQFSLGYGVQQFDSSYLQQSSFYQHNIFFTVGLFVY